MDEMVRMMRHSATDPGLLTEILSSIAQKASESAP